MVKLLCDAGAAKDQAKDEGTTPLFMTSQEGHAEEVKLLCDGGAAKDQAMNDGATLLYMASYNGHVTW